MGFELEMVRVLNVVLLIMIITVQSYRFAALRSIQRFGLLSLFIALTYINISYYLNNVAVTVGTAFLSGALLFYLISLLFREPWE